MSSPNTFTGTGCQLLNPTGDAGPTLLGFLSIFSHSLGVSCGVPVAAPFRTTPRVGNVKMSGALASLLHTMNLAHATWPVNTLRMDEAAPEAPTMFSSPCQRPLGSPQPAGCSVHPPQLCSPTLGPRAAASVCQSVSFCSQISRD